MKRQNKHKHAPLPRHMAWGPLDSWHSHRHREESLENKTRREKNIFAPLSVVLLLLGKWNHGNKQNFRSKPSCLAIALTVQEKQLIWKLRKHKMHNQFPQPLNRHSELIPTSVCGYMKATNQKGAQLRSSFLCSLMQWCVAPAVCGVHQWAVLNQCCSNLRMLEETAKNRAYTPSTNNNKKL